METEQIENHKPSFLKRAMDYVKSKKTQIIGATVLAGSMALAGCAIPLEKRVITPNEFVPGRLVTLTGEVMQGYKDEKLRSDLNVPLVVYNSVDTRGNNILINVHEDFRFGINDQAIKRIKDAINKNNYAIRVYGRTTYGDMEYDINGVKKEVRNVDADFITLTDKTGDVKLMLETDMDPIVALMGMITIPINVNPDISYGLQWPWHYSFGSMFDSMSWFAWISDWGAYGPCISLWWGAMRQDWDGDRIPNYMDPYPYDATNTGLAATPGAPNGRMIGYFNTYAGLNLHNYMAIQQGEKKLIIPEEGARLHPDFVNIFAHNRQADEYRAQVNAKRQELIKEYNSKPANARIRNAEPIFSTENIAKSAGIKLDQLQTSYNNSHVRTPGMMYERGSGLVNRGSMSSGAERGGGSGGYAIPSAGSATGSSVSSGERKSESSETAKGGTIKTEKK